MKKIFTILAAVILTAIVFAQTPEKMSYQAVIRDNANQLVTDTEISVKFSILDNIEGTALWIETQMATTNANGLLTVELGSEVSLDASIFQNTPLFIKTEIDLEGGTDYTITGTSQLLSVPYAFHAKTAETVVGEITESDPTVSAHVKDITTDNISDWNEAHGWGDHSAEAYLTDFTESDPTVPVHVKEITTDNISDWNEAHGWGDHSDSGYLTGETQNLADVLSYGNNGNALQIKNIADPTDAQDAATKEYVDLLREELEILRLEILIRISHCGIVTFTYNGEEVTYGTVEGQNGTCWMDRNLGASRAAMAFNDSEAYGDIFQWGRADDGHQLRNSDITFTLATSDNPGHNKFILNSTTPFDWRDDNNNFRWAATPIQNNPCPEGWRIPTLTELDNERTSWTNNNREGAFLSPLKLPVSGSRVNTSGDLGNVGNVGNYWVSNISGTNATQIFFSSANAGLSSAARAYGLAVRCIKD